MWPNSYFVKFKSLNFWVNKMSTKMEVWLFVLNHPKINVRLPKIYLILSHCSGAWWKMLNSVDISLGGAACNALVNALLLCKIQRYLGS
jgi:hypothetical protein